MSTLRDSILAVAAKHEDRVDAVMAVAVHDPGDLTTPRRYRRFLRGLRRLERASREAGESMATMAVAFAEFGKAARAVVTALERMGA